MIEFIQGFFDMLNHEKHFVDFADSSRADKLRMFTYKQKLIENLKKQTHLSQNENEAKICTSNKTDESAQNSKQDNVETANKNCTLLHIFKSKIADILEEKHIDVEIACDTYTYLQAKGEATKQDIVNYIHETVDPNDFNNETTPLKIDRHLNKMYMHDLLEFNTPNYELTQEFIDLVKQGGE